MGTRTSISPKTAVPAILIAIFVSILCAKGAQDVTVKIPFEFQAGGTHFAPGEYVLSMDKISTGSVMVRTMDHTRSVILLTRKSSSAPVQSAPVIYFRGYGESRFLSAIQSQNASQRWDLVPSDTEAALARTSELPMIASLKAEGSGTK
jgi:hypothetical protein